jgi:hypothetical protein
VGLFAVRDRHRLKVARRGRLKGARERPARGGVVVRGGGGSGWLDREQRQRKRKEKGSLASSKRVFGRKTVYRKIITFYIPDFSLRPQNLVW